MESGVMLGIIYAVIRVLALIALIIFVIWEIAKYGKKR